MDAEQRRRVVQLLTEAKNRLTPDEYDRVMGGLCVLMDMIKATGRPVTAAEGNGK